MSPLEEELGEPKERKPKVLFADDEESMRKIIGEGLLGENMGLSIDIASSTEEALEKIEKDDFTHVITDGFGGGWEKIVQAAQEKGMKVAVLSGDEEVKEQVLKEKDIRFIPKPMRFPQIREFLAPEEKTV